MRHNDMMPRRGLRGLWQVVAYRVVRWLIAALIAFPLAAPALAAPQSVPVIRDAEIEAMLRDFAAPLLKAAGLRGLPHIYIVGDRRFNAFVDEDGSLFVNYGTLLDVKSPNQLKGVIAHEIGHVAGGHLARLRERADATARMIALATVLGAGAMIAAGTAGAGQEITSMASAFIIGSQSAGINGLMGFRRGEESSADAAALKLLKRTKQSAKGFVEVMEYLNGHETPTSSPYLRTHPLPSDRLDQIEQAAKTSPYWNKTDSAADIVRLDRAQAKLAGFLESQTVVLNRYPNSDKSLAARYARTISAYKSGMVTAAIPAMRRLVAQHPSDPYFQELLGQMIFETGQPAKSLVPLKKAVALDPGAPLIRLLYGHALLTAGGKANLDEAVLQLTRVTIESPQSALAFNALARAYAALGNKGAADLAAARAALIRGDKGLALGLARKAKGELPQQSPMWLRADDILTTK